MSRIKERLKFILSFGNLPPNLSKPFLPEKTQYKILIPSMEWTLEAKNKKEAFKQARQDLNILFKAFLLDPKNWKELKKRKVKKSG